MERRGRAKIHMTNEARVLKRLRLAKNLSLVEAASLIGKSKAYVAHVETGRIHVPKGEDLDRFLQIYDVPNYKSFYDRVRIFEERITPKDELKDLVDRVTDEHTHILLKFVKALVA